MPDHRCRVVALRPVSVVVAIPVEAVTATLLPRFLSVLAIHLNIQAFIEWWSVCEDKWNNVMNKDYKIIYKCTSHSPSSREK